MTEQEFLEGITLIGEIFNKQYSQLEVRIYYDKVKDYDNETWTKTISDLLETEKFAPKIVDLLKSLEDNKRARDYPIIDYMAECGYFKRTDWDYQDLLKQLEDLQEQLKNAKESEVARLEEAIEQKEKEVEDELAKMKRAELHSIEKCKMWIKDNTIPDWLERDIAIYKQQIMKKQNLLN